MMKRIKAADLQCDLCGARSCFYDAPIHGGTVMKDGRQSAREAGWIQVNPKLIGLAPIMDTDNHLNHADLCPNCVTKVAELVIEHLHGELDEKVRSGPQT